MMPALVFETDDMAVAEQFIADAYARMRLEVSGSKVHIAVERRVLGPVTIDDFQCNLEMKVVADPLGKVHLCRVHEGSIGRELAGSNTLYGRGAVCSMGPPNNPIRGECHQPRHNVILFDEDLFDRVARVSPGRESAPVRLTGHHPVSLAASGRLVNTIDYLRHHVLGNPVTSSSDLLASTAAQYLATVVLATFPNTAVTDATIEDRRDSTPVLLRRAMAFIDDNAHTDIALADIADAVHVTPRALQYMFRKQLDCTPIEYVRRVRLNHAHRELLKTDRYRTTVGQIAARWGFGHTGRFAAYYREVYGKSPHATLREDP